MPCVIDVDKTTLIHVAVFDARVHTLGARSCLSRGDEWTIDSEPRLFFAPKKPGVYTWVRYTRVSYTRVTHPGVHTRVWRTRVRHPGVHTRVCAPGYVDPGVRTRVATYPGSLPGLRTRRGPYPGISDTQT